MTPSTENLIVTFEVDTDAGTERINIGRLSVLPRIGESVECNYVHGTKITFEVKSVHHHLANVGEDILQQITVCGSAI